MASDCVENDCSETRGPDRHLPSPDLDTHALMSFFEEEFGFDARDTVAIMGSHTWGVLARENSGFDGADGWLEDTVTLGNGYYGALIGGQDSKKEVVNDGPDWKQVYVDNSEIGTLSRWEWERQGADGKHYVMTGSDMAIVRDLEGQLDDEGRASCEFKTPPKGSPESGCPVAKDTLGFVAEYKFNNAIFLEDFESAMKRMLLAGQEEVTSVARRSLGALRGGQD